MVLFALGVITGVVGFIAFVIALSFWDDNKYGDEYCNYCGCSCECASGECCKEIE